ncbi:MAG: hypothetical protein M3198_07225 [Actinomycetota bacterium]|nr:hypothetical protein [Actinomycetota bacterium]
MSDADRYRPLSRLDLLPVFMSLGIPREGFRGSDTTADRAIFDAVLNADLMRPNILWLFKGADYFVYNLLSGQIERGPLPIAGNWGGDSLPGLFTTGIHAAMSGGPAFPHLWYFFKDEMYVVMDSTQGWRVVEGPRGVLGVWASGAWTDAAGKWKTPGVPVALHGLGSEFDGMIHFFKDGQYIRHNLRTGTPDSQLMAIAQGWNLPEPFVSRIDLAFYGTGATAENIFFIAGEQYALYDFRKEEVLVRGSIDVFPAFARFLGRPQLFLVEDYSLETLVGPVHLGRLVDTRSIGAGSTIRRILVTETTDTTRETLGRSLLESQDSSVVSNFYDNLDRNTSTSEESERYKYQLNASFHGEAKATSVWGGEVDATLNVAGGTDNLRSGLSEATFKSIRNQVDESKRATEQKTYTNETEILSTVKVLKKEIFEETNTSDRVRVYQFFEQLQPYVTLLTLQNVRIAFSDGTDTKVVELRELGKLLRDVLIDQALEQQLTDYLRDELSQVSNYRDEIGSLLVEGAPSELVLKRNLTSTYDIPMPDGTMQTLSVRGYLKADRSWIEPTFTITCIQS